MSENTIEELIEISLDPEDSNKKVLVGAQLIEIERKKVAECLKWNKDIFAWSHKAYQEWTQKMLNIA